MPRIRSIKPGFFANELLAELPPDAQLLFIGLWTIADREGRLEDRPRRIKGELFRYREIDVDHLLNELQKAGFVRRYTAEGVDCIQVVNFGKHQRPNKNEVASELPPEQPKPIRRPIKTGCATNQSPPHDAQEGERREGTGRREESATAPGSARKAQTSSPPTDEAFLSELQAEPAYQRLDVRHVNAKMVAWCKGNGKQPTRRRLIAWLNREDQPITSHSTVKPAAKSGTASVGAPSPPPSTCGKPARYTFTWPDCEPAFCCEECLETVKLSAAALNLTVHTGVVQGEPPLCP